jgi:RNA polymerase-binding transcription factor DksA
MLTPSRTTFGPKKQPAISLLQHHAQAEYEYEEQVRIVEALRQELGDSRPDLVDGASRSMDYDSQLLVADSLRNRRDVLAAAVQRESDGTYGLCDDCGKPIAEERLQIAPAATACVSCQSSAERLRR